MFFSGPESEFLINNLGSPERKCIAARDGKVSAKPSNANLEKEGSPRRSKNKSGIKPNRAKSRPSPQRSLPGCVSYTSSESEAPCTSDIEITYENQEIKFSDNLENLDLSIKNEVVKSKKGKSQGQKSFVIPDVPQDTRSKEEILKEEKLKAQEAERKQKILEKKARKQAAIESRKLEQEAGVVFLINLLQNCYISNL